MENEVLSLIASFLALLLVACSYFVNKKRFLMFQSLGIIFLILSYFFNVQYFALVGMVVSLARTLTFYYFESKDKNASIFWPTLFAGLTLVSYLVINLGILGTAQPIDLLCLISLSMYAFVFRIRSIKHVRFFILIPTTLAILFNVLAKSAIFVTVSYGFEMGANVASIFKYHVFGKKKQEQAEKKESGMVATP